MTSGYSLETWRHTPAIHSDIVRDPGTILARVQQENERGSVPLAAELDRTQPVQLRLINNTDGRIHPDNIVFPEPRLSSFSATARERGGGGTDPAVSGARQEAQERRRSSSARIPKASSKKPVQKPRVAHVNCSISKAEIQAEKEQEYLGLDSVMPAWDPTVALDSVDNPYRPASLRKYFGRESEKDAKRKIIFLRERVPTGVKFVTAFEEQGLDLNVPRTDPVAVLASSSKTVRTVVTTGPTVLKLENRGLRDTILTPDAIDMYNPKAHRIENDDADDLAEAADLINDPEAVAAASAQQQSGSPRAVTSRSHKGAKRPTYSHHVSLRSQDAEFNYRSAVALSIAQQKIATGKEGVSLTLESLGLHLNHRDFISDVELDGRGVESAIWIWRRVEEAPPELSLGWSKVRIDLNILTAKVKEMEEQQGEIDFSSALEAATTAVETAESTLEQHQRNPAKLQEFKPRWCFDHQPQSRKNPHVHPSRRVFFASNPAPPQRLPVSTPVHFEPHVFVLEQREGRVSVIAKTSATPSLTQLPQELHKEGALVEKLSRALIPPLLSDIRYSQQKVPAVLVSQPGIGRNCFAAIAAMSEQDRSAFSGGNTPTSTTTTVTTPDEFIKKSSGTWKHPISLRPESIDPTFTQSHSGFSELLGKPLKGPYAPKDGEVSYAERQQQQAANQLVTIPSNAPDAHLQFSAALAETQEANINPKHRPAVASLLLKERGWSSGHTTGPNAVAETQGIAASMAKQAATGRVMSLDGRTLLPKVGGLTRSEALAHHNANNPANKSITDTAARMELRGAPDYVDEVSYEFTEADGAAISARRATGMDTSVVPKTSSSTESKKRENQKFILTEQDWNPSFSTLRSSMNDRVHKSQREYFDRKQVLADQRTHLDVTLRERSRLDAALHAKATDGHLGLPIEQDMYKMKARKAQSQSSAGSSSAYKQTQLPGDPYDKMNSDLFNVMSYLQPPDELKLSVAVAVDKARKSTGITGKNLQVLRDVRTEVVSLGDQALQASLESRLVKHDQDAAQDRKLNRKLRRQQRLMTLERAARAQRELGWNPHHHVRRSIVNENLYKTQRDLLSAPKEEERFEFESLEGTSKDLLQAEQREYVLGDVWDRFNDLITKRMLRNTSTSFTSDF